MPQEKSRAITSTDGKNKQIRKRNLTGDSSPASKGSHFKPANAVQTYAFAAKAPSRAATRVQGSATAASASLEGRAQVQHESPHGLAKRGKKRAGGKAAPYSRYNQRYIELAQTAAKPQGLAFELVPYCVYGGIAVVATLLWCAVACTAGKEAASASLIGLVLLCVVVIGGIALAVVIAKLTMDSHKELDTVEIAAAAIGRSALAMMAAVLVWVLASAVASV